MLPEILPKDDFSYPHELPKNVTQEAYFQRQMNAYRSLTLKNALAHAVEQSALTTSEVDAAVAFLGGKNQLSVNIYCLAKMGLRPDLEGDAGYLAADKALSTMGLGQSLSKLSALDLDK